MLTPVVRTLAAVGVTPNMLSVAGLLGNVAAGVLVGNGALLVGGLVMLLASGLDMLDGALARMTGKASKSGALLDSTFDRLSEAAVLFGVLLYALDHEHEFTRARARSTGVRVRARPPVVHAVPDRARGLDDRAGG